MEAVLIGHTFPDDSSWELVDESIPIGTKYRVLHFCSEVMIKSLVTGKVRTIPCYLVERDGSEGFLPACILKVLES